jgi:hypothetical protein
MRTFIAIFLLVVCELASATGRDEKVREIMKAQGLMETFEQQIGAGRERTQRMATDMLDRMMSSLNPPEEFQREAKAAYGDFLEAAQPHWTAQDLVGTWAKYYGPELSDEELDQILQYYRSPVGQKEVTASREAMVGYRKELAERYDVVLKKATDDFIKRIQDIVVKCHCKKTSAAQTGHQMGTETLTQQ